MFTQNAGQAPFLFGFWVLFRSSVALGLILSLKKDAHDLTTSWKTIIWLPITGILLGLIFLSSPMLAGGFIIGIFSFAIISFGIFELYWGMSLKKNGN